MKSTLHIKTGFFPLAWFLFFVTPNIEINGNKYPKKWGEHPFEVAPGEYTVKISFPYFGMKECGANQVKVSVAEGETKRIKYNMPAWMFAKGKITVS